MSVGPFRKGQFSTVHVLKCEAEFFDNVWIGIKSFEIRKNDRGYKVEDFLILRETKGVTYTGREIHARIVYMTTFEQKDGMTVLSLGNQKHIVGKPAPLETPFAEEPIPWA